MSLNSHDVQQFRNLALLARQAIANQSQTMPVNPTLVASACAAVEAGYSAFGSMRPVEDAQADARKIDALNEQIRGLHVELNAERANVRALTAQIEARYQDGLRDGARGAEAQLVELQSKIRKLESISS